MILLKFEEISHIETFFAVHENDDEINKMLYSGWKLLNVTQYSVDGYSYGVYSLGATAEVYGPYLENLEYKK